MNISAFIPLIATIAYIPLFIILLSNRPWQRRHRLFFLFLIPAMLWSFSTFLFRSDWSIQEELIKGIEIKIVICMSVWMLIQLRYFVYSFYQSERIKIPWAYIFPIATIVLAVVDPDFVKIVPADQGFVVHYSKSIIAIFLLFLSTFGVKDGYYLIKKYRLSPIPAERNQIIYLLGSIVILTAFFLSSISPRGGAFPVSHIGNFIIACVLTYAVVTHRLLDIRVIFRRAFLYLALYGASVSVLLLFFILVYRLVNFELNLANLALTISLGIPAILFFAHKVRDRWQAKVEQAFTGTKYPYRQQLSQFITRINNVPALEQLGSGLILLLAQSIDCRRACLLLPEAGNGNFSAQFFHPPVEDNPIRILKLKMDSPIVTWLRQKKKILTERDLDISPEFQSIWQGEREEIRSIGIKIFVPLINMEELVAILAISERRDGKLYNVEDIDLLELVTAQVAASIEKEYLHERLKEQDKEITLVNRLTTIITSSMSIQMIFEGFAQELKEVVDIDWATIALIDEAELYVVALSSTIGSAWQTEQRISLEGTGAEWVHRERTSLYEPDLKRHHRFKTGEQHLQHGIRSIVYLPLNVTDRRNIGSLIVASRKPNAYNPRQIKLLEKVALQVAAPIENAQLYARAEQRSRIDELTGLFNRRHLEERLKEEISRHSRHGEIFSILLLDLDNFKTYNDIYGHPAGDVILNHVGKITKSSIRNADQAFRYGGDEFAVLLPQTSIEDAYVVAERVRRQIATEMEEKETAVTCSIGLASYPSDGVMGGELVTVADTALYYAKRTGGNRAYLSSKILSEPLEHAGTYARHNGLSAVYALVSTVEAKDPHTYGHSKKVNTYAVALAEAIGLSPDEVFKVSTAALLHDIGKIGIPDRVLNKKEKLNKEDWEAIIAHPKLGTTIIGNIPNLVTCTSSILHHHERWDGSGYPEGLKGEEIPIEARILAIADSFEAMSSARPYRPALSPDQVLKELKQGAGSQFDPKLVEVFIGIVEAGLPERVKISQDASSAQPGQ